MLTLSKIRRAARSVHARSRNRSPLDPSANAVLLHSQLLTMEEKDPKRLFEGNALIRRLVRVGVLDESRMKLDYVLALKVEDFLERRLQTCVYKLGLAKSIHHARVLIRQRHIRFVTIKYQGVWEWEPELMGLRIQRRKANCQCSFLRCPSRLPEAYRLCSYFAVWRRASWTGEEKEG